MRLHCLHKEGYSVVRIPFDAAYWTSLQHKLTKFQVTPVEACQNPIFFSEAVNGQCKLKRNHAYYTQVQGQMGSTGASWCDFTVYTRKGIQW